MVPRSTLTWLLSHLDSQRYVSSVCSCWKSTCLKEWLLCAFKMFDDHTRWGQINPFFQRRWSTLRVPLIFSIPYSLEICFISCAATTFGLWFRILTVRDSGHCLWLSRDPIKPEPPSRSVVLWEQRARSGQRPGGFPLLSCEWRVWGPAGSDGVSHGLWFAS